MDWESLTYMTERQWNVFLSPNETCHCFEFLFLMDSIYHNMRIKGHSRDDNHVMIERREMCDAIEESSDEDSYLIQLRITHFEFDNQNVHAQGQMNSFVTAGTKQCASQVNTPSEKKNETFTHTQCNSITLYMYLYVYMILYSYIHSSLLTVLKPSSLRRKCRSCKRRKSKSRSRSSNRRSLCASFSSCLFSRLLNQSHERP
jgi:hypothetical protein